MLMTSLPKAVAIAAVLIAVAAVPQAASAGETFSLDSYEAVTLAHPNDGAAGPVSSAASLAAGELYLVTVRGTSSAFRAPLWTAANRKTCGASEPAPLVASPLTANGQVGLDSEFEFARTVPKAAGCAAYPRPQTLFELNTGSGFLNYAPWSGQPAGLAASHQYSYLLQGSGVPLSVRIEDSNTDDNYGVYSITILDKDGCKGGGWVAYGVFKNQGDCVSFFATKGKNPPALSGGVPPLPMDMGEDAPAA
jgi:hypothetical protein